MLAIAIGLIGLWPPLPTMAMLFGMTILFLVFSANSWSLVAFFECFAFLAKAWPDGFANVGFLFQFFIAPTALLWGLLKIQRSERARHRIVIITCVFCAVTVPFALGLLLVFPLFLCVFVPTVIRYKNRDKAQGLGPGDGQAP
jgi:hypothetical protein